MAEPAWDDPNVTWSDGAAAWDGGAILTVGAPPPRLNWHIYRVAPWLHYRLGEIDQFTKAAFVMRFNDVGSFVIDGDPGCVQLDSVLWDPVYGRYVQEVELVINGESVFMGPVQSVVRRGDAGGRTLTVSGNDQNVWLEQRVAHPDPDNARYPTHLRSGAVPPVWDDQVPGYGAGGAWENADHDTFTGPASQAIAYYIRRNAAEEALAPRRAIRGLVAGTPPALGAVIETTARYQPLIELAQAFAAQAGEVPLGFRLHAWQLAVWQPQDTGVTFDLQLGNIESYITRWGVDDLNVIYTAGQGELRFRQFYKLEGYLYDVLPDLGGAEPPFGIVERFRDRRDTNSWEVLRLVSWADCRSGIRRPQATANVLDTPQQRFGRDYRLGDLVHVRMAHEDVLATVSKVTFILEPGKPATVTPTVGTDVAISPLRFIQRLDNNQTRLNSLERV